MRGSIITIGNELLKGYTIDTNASFIGEKLTQIGVDVVWKCSIQDNVKEIIESLKIANKKSEIIICTGGLGPTLDDITINSISKLLKKDLIVDLKYLEELKNYYLLKGIEISNINKNQSLIVRTTNIIKNDLGSARGIDFIYNKSRFFILPGVPKEMKKMFNDYILNQLEPMIHRKSFNINIKTFGIVESKIQEIIQENINFKNISISFLPSYKGVQIILTSKSKTVLEKISSKIIILLDEKVYSNENISLEEVIFKLLLKNNLTFSIAESCSGGLTSDLITNIFGSSKIFKGSIVSYSNESKVSLIGVSEKTIKKFGAVSNEVAIEMAIGVKKKFKSDIGLSITGIAGPNGSLKGKPVGFTCFGISDKKGEFVYNKIFSNHRRTNKELSSRTILNLLRLKLMKKL